MLELTELEVETLQDVVLDNTLTVQRLSFDPSIDALDMTIQLDTVTKVITYVLAQQESGSDVGS